MKEIAIHTEDIQLDQLLKLADVVSSGGQVKYMAAEGSIQLNGKVVTARRKKVKVGDIVTVDNDIEIKVIAEADV